MTARILPTLFEFLFRNPNEKSRTRNPENISAGQPTRFCQNFKTFFGGWGLTLGEWGLTFWGLEFEFLGFDSLDFGAWFDGFWSQTPNPQESNPNPQKSKSQTPPNQKGQTPSPRKNFEWTDQSGVNSNRVYVRAWLPNGWNYCSHAWEDVESCAI